MHNKRLFNGQESTYNWFNINLLYTIANWHLSTEDQLTLKTGMFCWLGLAHVHTVVTKLTSPAPPHLLSPPQKSLASSLQTSRVWFTDNYMDIYYKYYNIIVCTQYMRMHAQSCRTHHFCLTLNCRSNIDWQCVPGTLPPTLHLGIRLLHFIAVYNYVE